LIKKNQELKTVGAELQNRVSNNKRYMDDLSEIMDLQEKIKKSDSEKTEDADKIKQVKKNLEDAEYNLYMFKRKKEADAKFKQISGNAKIQSVLKPQGLRQEFLSKAVENL